MKFPSVTRSVTTHLKERIITGKLKGGERLHENNLSEQLGIGRPPLRESFRLLENSCLVQNIPRKGTFVTSISEEEFDEIHGIRVLLEEFAIDLFKSEQKSSFPSIEEVVKPIKIPPVYDLDDPDKLLELWKRMSNFHVKIIEESNNKYLNLFYSIIIDNLSRYQIIYLKLAGAGNDSIIAHSEILSYLKNKKYDEAKEALNKHLQVTYNRIKEKIIDHIKI